MENLRRKAIDHCRRYTTQRPNIPSTKLTEDDSSVEAIIEPMAMVTAKSKLDILEKLRFPKRRVSNTTVM